MSNHKINELCHLFDANSTPNVVFFLVPNIWVQVSEKLKHLQKSSQTSTTIIFFVEEHGHISKGTVCHQTICWKWFHLVRNQSWISESMTLGHTHPWLHSDSRVEIWPAILMSCQVGPVHLLAVYTKIDRTTFKTWPKDVPTLDSWWVQTSQQLNHLRELPHL